MSLFADSGNTDIDGATVVNACYGGTAALLNALAWADSSAWDGRFAIVVAADIAVYAAGPARPTGGCGAVAMLIGRDAPLRIDLQTKATHASHVWDFFKPIMDSEYPEVNGALSQTCYLRALDDCYNRFIEKTRRIRSITPAVRETDYFLFHSPYNKLVQKSFARLVYLDILSGAESDPAGTLSRWREVAPDRTYEDKELEGALKALANPLYTSKVSLGCEISRQIGNTYTASVYMNLACLVSTLGDQLINKRVTLFSYGSGALASMFSIDPVPSNGVEERFSLSKMQAALDISARLRNRKRCQPAELTAALEAREHAHGKAPLVPTFPIEAVEKGTFYLEEITSHYERIYRQRE